MDLIHDEIADLGKMLPYGALAKISEIDLNAVNVDINAIMTGAGEALIA